MIVCDFPDGFFPYEGQRIKDFFEELKARLLARRRPHPPARRPAPGPPPHLRADLEHVPRPPDPRVRGAQVRRRHGRARTPSSRSTSDSAQRKIDHLMEHFGTQRSKRWFKRGPVLGPAPAARHGVQLAELVRRGVLLPQGGARVSTDLRPTPGATDVGADAYELMRAAVPALPQPHRRRRAGNVRHPRRGDPDHAHRGPERHAACSTGSCPTSGTSATRTSRRRTARASSTSATRPCTSSPTASRCARRCRSRQLRERLHTLPDQPGPDPVPHLVLRRAPGASASRTASCSSSSRATTRS